MLAGEERRTAGRARLLAVVVQEADALVGDPIDVGRVIAHQPIAVATEVGGADVVSKDDEDIRWFSLPAGMLVPFLAR